MQSAIPPRLRALLDDSAHASATLGFAECCDRVLADNKMPFFPAYTDHGTAHVGSVLAAAERLVPDQVWKGELLDAADAAVLIGASFLHDLALHLREPGFLVLVSGESAFKPLPWFGEEQRNRPADLAWPALWHAFRREARRFSQSQLDRILGADHGDSPQILFGENDLDPASWSFNDRLLIGEFLRRHHARLAHEIAIYGLPGISASEFPVLASSLPALAEAIGATARSHNEDMRVVSDYLEARGNGDLRPDGTAQLYLMGILRVADYFQLEADRATPLLLHLREPQSPASVEEWEKHQAISAISWEHRDPRAVSIQVSPDHSLRTHLQLSDLIADLQSELDVTAAVLSETYGTSKLSALELSLQRVRTNLHEPDLHQRLHFVPKRARMRSAEDLFRLVVDDLYGNEPAVAGRELLQNAVDAVRERRSWESRCRRELAESEFRDQDADVVVEVLEAGSEVGVLRISDRGIGMTVSTVIDSFLTAGATFSAAMAEGEPGPNDPTRWLKAGRFGVGVFAAFLLGGTIQVTTRHPDEERGVSFMARMGDDLVQLDWEEDAPLGTEIIVPYASETLGEPGNRSTQEDVEKQKHRELLSQIRQFFVLRNPSVEFTFRGRDNAVESNPAIGDVPDPGRRLPDQWRSIDSPGFDAILWSLPARMFKPFAFAPWNAHGAELAHNGILIRKPSAGRGNQTYKWGDGVTREILKPPSVAVFDTQQTLKLALNRYELASPALPFEEQLLESIGLDLVAHALARGEVPHPLADTWGMQPLASRKHWIPLIPDLVREHVAGPLCVLLVDAPEEQPIAKRFLKGRTKGGQWRHLPYRAALPPLEIFSMEDLEELEWKDDDSIHRDHAEKEVTRSIDEFTSLFRMWPSTGVLVRPYAPQPITTIFAEKANEEPDELLAGIGLELAQGVEIHADYFALVVLHHVGSFEEDDGEPWVEPLARSWEGIFGGMLERSPLARERRRQDLTATDGQLRDLVEKWERFVRTPKWPARG